MHFLSRNRIRKLPLYVLLAFLLREISPLTPLEQDCRHAPSGHKFKDDRELETVATRWPIIKVTDFHKQSIE
jgi:hypothetical protein